MRRHYEAYIEGEDGVMWGVSMGKGTAEEARLEAFVQLSRRQGSEPDYKPARLIVFECSQVEVREFAEKAVQSSKPESFMDINLEIDPDKIML